MTGQTNNLVERLRQKTITHTNAVGLGFQQVSHYTLDPDCHEAAALIEELVEALSEAGKAFKRLADGEVGQPENLAFNGWQMIERVLESGK